MQPLVQMASELDEVVRGRRARRCRRAGASPLAARACGAARRAGRRRHIWKSLVHAPSRPLGFAGPLSLERGRRGPHVALQHSLGRHARHPRARLLRECGLVEKWARAAVDDAPVRRALAERGLRLRFVPSLMMINREDCTMPFSLDFVTRQLMWTRLYHPNWLLVVIHAAFTTAILAASLASIVCGWAAGNVQAATWAVAGLGFYLAAMLILTGILESSVRHVARARGESVAWLTASILVRLPAAILVTQAMHAFAVVLATVKRCVTWRGVTYHIASPWDIRLLENRPLEPYAKTAGSNMSL